MGTSVTKIIVTIATPVIIGITGYFSVSISHLTDRVDGLQTQVASTKQETSDIDARLTRIENKLDTALQTSIAAK